MQFDDDIDEENQKGFFRRNRFVICAAAVVLTIAGLVIHQLSSGKTSAPEKEREVTIHIASLPPPPPPPPPPPVPPPPQQQTMIKEKVDDAPPKEDKPDPAPVIGTNNKGAGSGPGMGVGSSDSGLGGRRGGGSGNGTKWSWWASKVQSRITDALHKNTHTRNASLSVQVRIWADSTGQITRATLANSTDGAEADAALREALRNMRLDDPPPAGMPMPVVLRITAKRPQ